MEGKHWRIEEKKRMKLQSQVVNNGNGHRARACQYKTRRHTHTHQLCPKRIVITKIECALVYYLLACLLAVHENCCFFHCCCCNFVVYMIPWNRVRIKRDKVLFFLSLAFFLVLFCLHCSVIRSTRCRCKWW